MVDERLIFNGIIAESGKYLSEFTLEQLANIAKGARLDASSGPEIRQRAKAAERHLGVAEGIDRANLAQTGWGVIFSAEAEADPAIKEALKPLLDLRRAQAGEYYFEFVYMADEDKTTFLKNRGAQETGPADPVRGMPYYLLLVGDPENIPYRFQHLMDVTYSVGRLHFDGVNALASYANYAANVVAAENGRVRENQRLLFFGPSNADDRATTLSSNELAHPLVELLKRRFPNWQHESILGASATKESLAGVLNGREAPRILFTASHGMAFSKENEKQITQQGALLCADWPGPEEWQKEIPENFYFHADDLSSSADLRGMIAFHFACYGGGTPKMDSFAQQAYRDPQPIAVKSFVAALPQRMLGLTHGALAVICHIERAWGYSFLDGDGRSQVGVFENTLRRLVNGGRVGAAVEFFNDKYAELATELSDMIENNVPRGLRMDQSRLANLWTSQNDARGYAILGDPAACLSASKPSANKVEAESIAVGSPRVESPELPKAQKEGSNSAAVDFGFADSFSDVRQRTSETLKMLTGKLNDWIEHAVDDLTSLEVATFVTEDMKEVSHERDRFTGNAQLCALTRLSVDGDMQVCVPVKEGELSERLWQVHKETVEQAQKQRLESLKAVGSIVSELLSALKFLPL